MFFKKKMSSEQFEFATIIGAAQIYKSQSKMPSASQIEDAVVEIAKQGNLKVSEEQMNVLRLAGTVLQMGEFPALLEKVASGKDPEGKIYAEIVTKLGKQVVRFI
jgi:hypothetical protein